MARRRRSALGRWAGRKWRKQKRQAKSELLGLKPAKWVRGKTTTHTHKIKGPAHGTDPITGKKVSRGWSRTTKLRTRIKRWARRKWRKQKSLAKKDLRRVRRKAKFWIRRTRKKLWRKSKQRAKRSYRKALRWAQRHRKARLRPPRKRPVQRVKAQPTKDGGVEVTTEQDPGGYDGPPPDGTISTCRLGGGTGCGNEIVYNAAHGRWEHTGRGNAACFGK